MKRAKPAVLDHPITQGNFAALVGLSDTRVTQLVNDGTLPKGATGAEWVAAYCARLREQAGGRAGSGEGGLDLVQERAALAREQRRGIEVKNAVLRGQYADVSLLAEVLAAASQSIGQRLDMLPGQLRKQSPDMPQEVLDAMTTAIAAARNEWVRATAELVAPVVEGSEAEDEDEPRAD